LVFGTVSFDIDAAVLVDVVAHGATLRDPVGAGLLEVEPDADIIATLPGGDIAAGNPGSAGVGVMGSVSLNAMASS
jgi:hypothetical protein